MAQAERRLHSFEGTVGRTSRGALGSLGRLAGTAGFAGVAASVFELGKAGVAYEQQMSRVKAVTNANAKEMRQLGALAKRMGADTKFSAAEAAQGMYELGAAGFKVNEMGDALKGTLALAAASNIDLAQASEITANTLRGFGLNASKTTHVADVLARTVNASSVEMGDLQLSMKYIAAPARDAGQSLEQMAAAVGLMGDAGIKGEQAGTTLRQAMIRLTKPTKSVEAGLADLHLKASDLQGPKGLKPLSEIVGILEKRTDGMGKAQRNAALTAIFGTNAYSGMSAVVARGSAALERNTRANQRADGAARKAAKTMQDNVAGAWENLRGSIETAGISIYEHFQKPLKAGLLDATHTVNDAAKDFEHFFDTVGRDPKFRSGDLADKLAVIGDELERRHVPEKITHVVVEGIEKGGEAAVHIFEAAAPGVAKAFVEGFIDAPIWLRALGVGFLLRKLGGLRALQGAGAQAGAAYATGFTSTSGVPAMRGAGGPAAVVVPGAPGRASGAVRRGVPTTVVAARQLGPGWENFRSGAPVSMFGEQPGRIARGASRAGGFVRGAGAGLMSAFGGPWGLALGAGLVAAPVVAQRVGARSQQFGLKQTGGKLGELARSADPRLIVRDPVRFLTGNDPEQRMRSFGDTAEKRLAQLSDARVGGGVRFTARERRPGDPKAATPGGFTGRALTGDVRGLQQLAKEARAIAEDYPKAARQLTKFADAAEDAADRAAVAHHGLRGTRIKASDIIDTQAASMLENDMRRLARDGVSSIKDLRAGVESNQQLISRAFQGGSKSAADAMASNFRAGMTAVKRSMADGRISAKDGMTAIRQLVRQQMRATAGSMDQFSDDGRAALAKNFRSAADAIRTQMRRGQISTKDGMAEIRRLMTQELQAYGLSADQARNVAKTGDVDANRGREGGATRKAGGGWIMGRGYRGHDKHHAMLGAGEFVANDPMQPELEQGLALAKSLGVGRFGSLDELERASTAGHLPKHYLAGGGRVTGDTDYGQRMRRALNAMARATGRDISVTSGGRTVAEQLALKRKYGGSRPVAGPNGPHVRGIAADIRPGREAFGSVAGRFGLGFPIAVEPWHAQLLDGNAGTATADLHARLRRVQVKGVHGTLRRIAQGAVNRVHGAAQTRLRHLVAADGGGDGTGPTGGGGSHAGARAEIERLWVEEGGDPRRKRMASAIAMAESSGNADASSHNPVSGGTNLGWFQIDSGSHADATANKRGNVRAAIRISKNGRDWSAWETYGNGAYRQYLARGGRPRLPKGWRRGMRISPAQAIKFGLSRGAATALGLVWRDPVTVALARSPISSGALAAVDETIGDYDQDIALQQRADQLTEEDLGTPEGRATQAVELGRRIWGQQGIVNVVRGQERSVSGAMGATSRALRAARLQQRAVDRAYRAQIHRLPSGRASGALQSRIDRGEDRLSSLRDRLRGTEGAARRSLQTQIDSQEDVVRGLRRQRRDAPTGRRRAQVEAQRKRALADSKQRVSRLERRRRELGKDAVRLRRTRRERQMDVRETVEARDQATGPNAVLEGELDMIDLRERAGELSTDDANAQREDARQRALKSGKLTDRQRLTIEADRRAGQGSTVDRVNDKLSEIDLHLRAGDYGNDASAQGRADEAKRQAIQGTLDAGGLSDREVLELRAQLADTTKAIEDARQSQEEHTAALKANTDEQKRANDITEGVMSVTGREAVRALANIMDGELGNRSGLRGLTPGDGRSWRF